MAEKVNSILKEVLEKVNPPEEDTKEINSFLGDFIKKFEAKMKKSKIKAEIFVGGSFAKKTMIKKGDYDIDIFVRFDKKEKNGKGKKKNREERKYKDKYKNENENENISEITEKVLKGIAEFSKVHGSRDYFKIVPAGKNFFVEVIPVLRIRNPKEAENITDLSYFHVNYIKKKAKSKKMLEDIRLAKAFCYANKCYGAESYVNGLSGYGIELLVYHYKGFLNFLKAVSKMKEKEVIDTEKHYKNRYEVLMNLNSAKLGSPIILVDPTYKQRNALAALSEKIFENFKSACKSFLKSPSTRAFETKKTDIGRIKENARKKKLEFVHIELETDKQEGDVAGSKLIKFYKHLESEVSKLFIVKNSGFDYFGNKEARCFFVVKSKKEIIRTGPETYDKENVSLFKKRHKRTFIKSSKIYAREKVEMGIKQFIYDWAKKGQEKMSDMHITEIRIIG
ncbi:MAG: nucleotidyltransferase domain-containing protein [Candidatus Pacearchaeota archaeon]|nr:nucleotidyltransferase domain-containing protein [Candidatus Pacearchaeota archaeon]